MDLIHIEEIQQQILKLSIDHKNMTDDDEAEYTEQMVEDLIVAYCESMNYNINGFPLAKKQLPPEELEDDYFCRERYQLYLDILSLEKEDIAILTWTYVSAFWPEQFDSKDEYLHSIKARLESGSFYDITLD